MAVCFSQEKDELVVGLTDGTREFWLKAQAGANFPAVALPEAFQRARANSVDLFPDLLGQQVETVVPWPQDRVLQLNFRSGARLVFKLYGPRPNAIFRPAPDAAAQLFQQKLLADADLKPQAAATPPAVGKLPRRLPTCPSVTCASTATTQRHPRPKPGW
ncbi:hypothetical protein ACFQT0_22415 [Hymenobacter humi]|uniref:Uncharacterized protein n=1 Tax=Hymenobacter humi TaxID=1411620 RepID=A0ABW2UA83_9BACT